MLINILFFKNSNIFIINLFSKILNILELIAFISILLFEYISGLKYVNETVY